jgi:hypothetical protein
MISSRVKVTAAMGALNAAAIPAATPTDAILRWLWREREKTLANTLEIPAQICTVGPSRPNDPPLPICTIPRTNLPIASRRGTCPACSA